MIIVLNVDEYGLIDENLKNSSNENEFTIKKAILMIIESIKIIQIMTIKVERKKVFWKLLIFSTKMYDNVDLSYLITLVYYVKKLFLRRNAKNQSSK